MNTKRLLYSVMSAVMFISGILLMFYFLWTNGYINVPRGIIPTEEITDFTYPSLPSEIKPSETKQASTETNQAETGETQNSNRGKSGVQYDSPVDFAELKKTNNEIVGWLYMTDPSISQPILMHKNNDDFYLSHNVTGKYSRDGSF